MSAEIINGLEVAGQLRADMKKQVTELKAEGLTPHLTVILIGEDPASQSYVSGKEKAASETGISSEVIRMDETTSENELLQLIEELNETSHVHGILVQLPLPNHIDEQKVIEAIDPRKDVDGFHPINVGKMMLGQETFLPCTPHGILKLLQSKDIDLEGKHAVIIGRSNIVGKPMGQLLLNENATVTYCHSRTKDLKAMTQLADILIVAVGREHFIDGSYIKKGAAVIDVGVNRTKEGTLTGDVDFDSAKEVASFITPVPRGVGPMTITMLLANTIEAAKRLENRE
ncbi:MAG TPA: bifunctional methylenetetrahydrofolate dehydrogenase/methenyltetrahydrofolate cyclohydrolase FolD [Pseudogracilibacillus sp.]|nr:bifunctional methylenetetrahydrofolate dehydrogenase/methenyltetrahydrofolate cyclohydrolase FolD [Pseudogracilibacillus sp.]